MKYVLDCISDTHNLHDHLRFPVPEGECVWILVHAGDYSHRGRTKEVAAFATWLRQQPHPHKVIINGNHECFTDPVWRKRTTAEVLEIVAGADTMYASPEVDNAKRLLRELRKPVNASKAMEFANFLHDSGTVIEGLSFYGSPYSLEFFNWAYMIKPEDAAAKWATIPAGADVLVIHGPPKWHGDRCPDKDDEDILVFVGDEELLKRIRVTRPLLVVCGHIHEGFGVYTDPESGTVIVNAAFVETVRTYRGAQMFARKEFQRVVIEDGAVTVTQVAVAG